MRAHHTKLILLLIGTFILTSCTTNLLFTSLDVMRPGNANYTPLANRLLIINNSVVQPANEGHLIERFDEKPINVVIPTDSLSLYCLSALAEDLTKNNIFTSVDIMPKSINKSKNFNTNVDLTDTLTKKLCTTNNANVILSLDRLQVADNLYELFLSNDNVYSALLALQIQSFWSIHYLDRPEITKIKFTDAMNWQNKSKNAREAIDGLPKRTDALIDGALNVGHRFTERILPHWEQVERYFFDIKTAEMRKGMDSVSAKNWDAAIKSFSKVANSKKWAGLRARAANNLAVVYEITGDLDSALKYARISLELFDKLPYTQNSYIRHTGTYVKELINRQEEIRILNSLKGE